MTLKRDKNSALHPIPTKFGQWNDLIITQWQAVFQLFSSYPPLGRSLSIWKISMRKGVMADVAEKSFILPKIGAKSFGIGIQDICKVSVSYLEPFAGF